MDELTIAFLFRWVRLRGRIVVALAAGALGLGLAAPASEAPDLAALLSLLAAWVVLAGCAADRSAGFMSAVLATPLSRRAWLVSYLAAAPVVAGFVCFACLLPNGARPALGAALFAFVYGWMIASLGVGFLLRAGRPWEAAWIGGAFLAFATVTASPTGPGAAWHPLTLFKLGLQHALSSSAGLGDLPFRWQGIVLPLFLSLIAWRWAIRTVDRLEVLPSAR